METISWRLTHSVTPRLQTIIYVSSKILSVFFIRLLYERQNFHLTNPFRLYSLFVFSVVIRPYHYHLIIL